MLQNAYFLAKIGADTAENEQHFAEILPKLATTLRVAFETLRAGDEEDVGNLPILQAVARWAAAVHGGLVLFALCREKHDSQTKSYFVCFVEYSLLS